MTLASASKGVAPWGLEHCKCEHGDEAVASPKLLYTQEQITIANDEEHHVILLEEISMAMTVHAHGLNVADFPEIQGYEWDVKQELDTFDWTDKYDNGLHYTNRSHDLSLPKDQLQRIARSVVFDARYEELKRSVHTPAFKFQDLLVERTQEVVQVSTSYALPSPLHILCPYSTGAQDMLLHQLSSLLSCTPCPCIASYPPCINSPSAVPLHHQGISDCPCNSCASAMPSYDLYYVTTRFCHVPTSPAPTVPCSALHLLARAVHIFLHHLCTFYAAGSSVPMFCRHRGANAREMRSRSRCRHGA